jgi:flagellar assembly protein FliH
VTKGNLKMSKTIFMSEEAKGIVVDYRPPKIPSVVTPSAKAFVSLQSRQAQSGEVAFKIDRIVAQQTGIAALEQGSVDEKVEQEVLNRMKSIQEEAYQQAYSLGLDQGKEIAFQAKNSELEESIEKFDQMLASLEKLKEELVAQNEGHIVKMAVHIAQRLMMDELRDRRDVILNVVRHSIDASQSEENIVVRLSPGDFSFIEAAKEHLGREYALVKKAKVESNNLIQDGGCIVETNYGEVDATLEKRIEKLWAALEEQIPKTTKTVGE